MYLSPAPLGAADTSRAGAPVRRGNCNPPNSDDMETTAEQRALKYSIAMTLSMGAVGAVTGLLTGSQAIIFDGMREPTDVT